MLAGSSKIFEKIASKFLPFVIFLNDLPELIDSQNTPLSLWILSLIDLPEKNGLKGIGKLPKSLKVLLENLLRYEDGLSVTQSQIESIKEWLKTKKSKTEIAYRPARVLLQDYTGIPAVADLAAMREAVKEKNKDPNTINPLSAVDLVIDHSVQVDQSAKNDSFEKNVDIEFERNGERYSLEKAVEDTGWELR